MDWTVASGVVVFLSRAYSLGRFKNNRIVEFNRNFRAGNPGEGSNRTVVELLRLERRVHRELKGAVETPREDGEHDGGHGCSV